MWICPDKNCTKNLPQDLGGLKKVVQDPIFALKLSFQNILVPVVILRFVCSRGLGLGFAKFGVRVRG